MATRSAAKRWTPEVARRELAQWQSSGLALAEYSRRQGYSAQRLSWWRKRLAAQAPAVGALELAPVVVTPRCERAVSVVVMACGSVRLELADAQGVQPQWLAAVVSVLRQESEQC